MKLLNKKTGKIIKLDIHCISGKNYESLAEINEDWEDYEEPKGYWYMSNRGDIRFIDDEDTDWDNDRKLIGNYFGTREEAEKAVEILKKLQNLKNRGYNIDEYIDMIIERGEDE